jgi:hypothetical protein
MKSLATLRTQLTDTVMSWRQQRLFQDRLSVSLLVTALALNALNVVILVLRIRPTDYPVPVHYSSLKSFDVLGPWYDRYWIGLFGLAVTLVNGWLALNSFQRSRIAIVVGIFCIIIANAFVAVT